MTGPRGAALAALEALFDAGRSFADTLSDQALAGLAGADRGLARALAFGVARHRRLLEALRDQRLERPLRPRQRRVGLVLALGLYQLGWMRIPAHAAVNETVTLLSERWARGLVNAVLRRYAREGAPVDLPGAPEAVRTSHPDWLARRLRADWDEQAARIMAENNREAPLWLRVDPAAGREQCLAELRGAGLAVEPGAAPGSLRLEAAADVTALPGFGSGRISVQDLAAQLAAPLLRVPPGGRILDACAAPGGKTLHLAALHPAAELVALDVDPSRLERVAGNLARAGAQVSLVPADLLDTERWWDARPFDAVLVDAPCSASGVLRRHPDAKWLRRPGDIAELSRRQGRLLDAGLRVLKPGGCLVYTTCSVLREENDRQVDACLARHRGLRGDPFTLPLGRAVGPGWQLFPGEGGADGFFYARLSCP